MPGEGTRRRWIATVTALLLLTGGGLAAATAAQNDVERTVDRTADEGPPAHPEYVDDGGDRVLRQLRPQSHEAEHAINNWHYPDTYNGWNVWISVTTQESNSIPCGDADVRGNSEADEAWHTADDLTDRLNAYGYKVNLLDRSSSYSERLDSAWDHEDQPDWRADVMINLHSNAGIGDCGADVPPNGGTEALYSDEEDTAADKGLGNAVMNWLAPESPGETHDGDLVSSGSLGGIFELDDWRAEHWANGYIEVEFHDTNVGANWIHDNHFKIGHCIAHGIDDFLADTHGGSSC